MLLPEGFMASTFSNEAIKNPATGSEWAHNPNWSNSICKQLTFIVCLQYFKNNPQFLMFVLAYALRCRIGEDDEKAPKDCHRLNIFWEGIQDEPWNTIVADTRQKMETPLTEEQEEVLKNILIDRGVITKQPAHWEFISILTKQSRKDKALRRILHPASSSYVT